MGCRKIGQLISPYFDRELTRTEADIVRAHLSACPGCQQEYEHMMFLSSALQELKQAVTPAPPGFSAAVMQRIGAGEKVVPLAKTSWLGRNWKQAVAGIAAAAMLLAGTLMNHAGPLVQIADEPPAVIQPGHPVTGDENPARSSAGDTTAIPVPDTIERDQGTPANGWRTQIAQNNEITEYQPVVFLSKDRFLVTTLLELRSNNSKTALDKAMELVSRSQAQVQNLGQQVNEGGSYTVYKITADQRQVSALISSLEKIGQVANKEVSRTDLNTQFADKLSQYQNLISQRAALQEQTDLEAMDKRIAALETELKNWDRQSGQETIILWLKK